MGRSKLPIQFVENPAKRKIHFQRRVRGVFKKVHELAVLCRVPLALIVGDEKKTPHFYRARCADDDFISAAIDTSSLSDRLMLYTPHMADFHNQHNMNMNMQVYQPPHDAVAPQMNSTSASAPHDGLAVLGAVQDGNTGVISSPAAQGSEWTLGDIQDFLVSDDDDDDDDEEEEEEEEDDEYSLTNEDLSLPAPAHNPCTSAAAEWLEIEKSLTFDEPEDIPGHTFINPSFPALQMNTASADHHAAAVGDNSNLNFYCGAGNDINEDGMFSEAAALLVGGDQSYNCDYSAVGIEDPRTRRMECWNLDEDQMMLPVPQLVQVNDQIMGCNEYNASVDAIKEVAAMINK